MVAMGRASLRRWAVLVTAALALASLPAVTALASTSSTTPSTIANAHWPLGLPSAYAAPEEGYVGTNFHGQPIAIASLTKMMTAVIVEQRLPLGTSGTGPIWIVTKADVEMTKQIADVGGVTITVRVGEQLSEHLLLEGLLVRSANNFAVMLTELCHLKMSSFVWAMNHEAALLGMDQTHYADPHGLSDSDTSTPEDQIKVAEKLETYPLLASIVEMTAVDVPIDGWVATWTPMLDTHGIIGIKTGTTGTAGGCDVLLVLPHVDHRAVPVYVAVFNARSNDVLATAGNVALNIELQVAAYLKSLATTTTTSSTTSTTTTSSTTTTTTIIP
jgi:D-alanyl-D-alanine carboxypeptidase (penicillin-binding protein 5/6)